MSRRILVVDDEPGICNIIEQALVEEQCVAEKAGSALEAIERLESAPCDLAIVDLLLPDVDGLQLAEAIRLLDPGTPVILMTAYGTPSFEGMASAHPAIAHYMHKPFELERLMDLVRRFVRC